MSHAYVGIERTAIMAEKENGQYKVLLVDDDAVVRFAVGALFKKSSFVCTAVGSAQDAVEKFKQDNYDAIISDVMMEPIDGFMFRDLIRSHNQEIPFIFLTALVNGVDNSLLTRIMGDSFSYYVPKNADRNFLIAKISQVVQNYRAQHTVRALEAQIAKSQELAGFVQRSLLPAWVRCDRDYEFSSLYKPLGKIGGDLFEWIPLGEHTCLSVFGDISGHGTDSALGMTAIQSFLKQMSLYKEEKAQQVHLVAQEINDFIVKYLYNAIYMCGLIVYWDFENNFCRYFNTGYMDIMAFDGCSGEQITVNPEQKGAMPLGMMGNTVYNADDTVEFHFHDDTLFLISSDGLWDLSRDEDGETGMDPDLLHELLALLIKQSHQEDYALTLPYRCYEALEQVGYTYPTDDFSMFMIHKPARDEQEKTFVCRVSPSNDAVDAVVQLATEFVMSKTDSLDLSTRVELLLEEHMTNILEHGFKDYHNENDFLVFQVVFEKERLRITVWDRGKEWNGDQVIMKQDPDKILQELAVNQADGGRGIPIMMKIASSIIHQRHCGLNETVFYLPFTPCEKDN